LDKLVFLQWTHFSIVQVLENICSNHHPHGIDTVGTSVNNPRQPFTLGTGSHEWRHEKPDKGPRGTVVGVHTGSKVMSTNPKSIKHQSLFQISIHCSQVRALGLY